MYSGERMNKNLNQARYAKKDEFYTRFIDIQNEVQTYINFNPNVFRGKTVLCPCDNPEHSNFTKFFVQNFERLGLKKLISTSYAVGSERVKYGKDLFSFVADGVETKGRIFVLDQNCLPSIDQNNLQWKYLNGSGDFNSDEIRKLRDEADFIITNPPFSLFVDFVDWIAEANKKFLIVGRQTAIANKRVFSMIKQNKIWLGNGFDSNVGFFTSPYDDTATATTRIDGLIRVSGIVWFTNIEHGKRNNPLVLMTEKENVLLGRHKDIKNGYVKYDNFDALEVPSSNCIPSDYKGAMGVPITFLTKYCPEQFEILGLINFSTEEEAGIPVLRYYGDFKEMRQDMTYTGSCGKKYSSGAVVKGKPSSGNFLYNPKTNEYVHTLYARIVIRHKKAKHLTFVKESACNK